MRTLLVALVVFAASCRGCSKPKAVAPSGGQTLTAVVEQGERHELHELSPTPRVLLADPHHSYFPIAATPRGTLLVSQTMDDPSGAHFERVLELHRDGGLLVIQDAMTRARNAETSANGLTVLEAGEAGDSRIVAVRDGQRVELTRSEWGDYEPSLSPDGTELVFTSSRNGTPDLYLVSTDGGPARLLFTTNAEDLSPRWSPTGEWIAFFSNIAVEDTLGFIRPDGGELTVPMTVKPPHKHLAWAKDGTAVVFADKAQVHVFDVAKQALRWSSHEADPADQPSVSADGKSLAYVVHPDGGTGARVVTVSIPEGKELNRSSVAAATWRPVWW